MNIKQHYLLLASLALIVFANPVYAETRVGKDALINLISGKTVEGKWMLWDSNYRMYVNPSGDFKRVYGKGDKLTNNFNGSWSVNKKGKLCFEVNNKVCRRVKQHEDGGYNLYNKKKVLKQTIEKITDGNPYNL